MGPKPVKKRSSPEGAIVDAVRAMLHARGWYTIKTHGSMYQAGLPDLYIAHTKYGGRWVEIKLPDMVGSHFTTAQKEIFTKLVANGVGVWIITAATETEYQKLFAPSNFFGYMLRKM